MSTNGYANGVSGGMVDHLPPQNLEAERSVLGGLLIDNTFLPAVRERLSVEDFYRDAHQVIYRAICDLDDAGKPIDSIILADELERRGQYKAIGGDEMLLEICQSVPHSANTVHHAAIVLQKSAMRQAVQTGTEIVRDGYSNLFTADQILESARAKYAQIRTCEAEPWPELTLQDAPQAPAFPTDVFPVALARFCRGAAAVTLAPHDLPGVAMLATASAAIGQSVNLFLKRTWHESPLLYLLVVAEPGKSKTPPIKLVVRPLVNIDGDLRQASKLDRAAWEEAKKAAGKSNLAGAEPPQQRARVGDITRETLFAILADNPRGVLADPDEATAWVGSFNEYKGKGTDRQFWLDIWSSRPISVDREGGRRSSWVASPLVTVLGGLPPDMLGALNEDQGRNDGFHDRLLFSYPAEFPQQEWIEDELDAADETLWHAVVKKLHKAPMSWDAERNVFRPHLVDFSPDAKEVWKRWYNEHCAQGEAEDAPLWMPGVWAKLRAYCARFCLILSRLRLATNPELEVGDVRGNVGVQDVLGAIRLIDYFKGHIARIQHRLTGGVGNREALAILAWIVRTGQVEFRAAEVRENLRRRFPDLASLTSPLRSLVEAGVIRPKSAAAPTGRRGPKPSPAYEVRPNLAEALKTPLGAPEITEITANSPRSPF